MRLAGPLLLHACLARILPIDPGSAGRRLQVSTDCSPEHVLLIVHLCITSCKSIIHALKHAGTSKHRHTCLFGLISLQPGALASLFMSAAPAGVTAAGGHRIKSAAGLKPPHVLNVFGFQCAQSCFTPMHEADFKSQAQGWGANVCAHCDHAMFGATTKYKRIVPGSIGRVRINNQRLTEPVKGYRSRETLLSVFPRHLFILCVCLSSRRVTDELQ